MTTEVATPLLPEADGEEKERRGRRTARGLCPELKAMAEIDGILSDLEKPEAARVLTWVIAKCAPGLALVTACRPSVQDFVSEDR